MSAPERFRELYEEKILERGIDLAEKAIERGLAEDASDAAVKAGLAAFKDITERIYGKVDAKPKPAGGNGGGPDLGGMNADELLELEQALLRAEEAGAAELVDGSTPTST